MHFALPTRGNYRSSPFLTRSVSRTYISARRPLYAIVVFVVVVVLLLRNLGGFAGRAAVAPQTVVVLVLNRTGHSTEYLDRVVENREQYAKAHGYGFFSKEITDYPGGGAPSGWARIPALRHAMATFKHSEYFWYLDQDAIIMNPALSIESHIVERLGSLIRRDVPIVPPDSVIKTYRHVPPERVQFILSQDKTGLQPGSMLLKAGPWSHYLLDAWYDPLFRFYNFAKAEQNALEHVVQWHPTILTKLALVPQRAFNSYPALMGTESNAVDTYQDGDFVVHFHECWKPGRNCEREFNEHWDKRRTR